jgi:phosphoribosylpyrophosphate synthetase
LHWEECIVVSPDEGGVKKSVLVANDLNLDFALIHNRNKPNKMYSKPETQLNGEPVAAVAASAEDDGARAELAALPEHKGLEMVKEDEERSRRKTFRTRFSKCFVIKIFVFRYARKSDRKSNRESDSKSYV